MVDFVLGYVVIGIIWATFRPKSFGQWIGEIKAGIEGR